MTNIDYHVPVMVDEVLENLLINKNGIYIDATFGGGGHSKKFLEKLDKNAKLFAFDCDLDTKKNAEKIYDKRLIFTHANFKYICNFLEYYGIEKVDGIFADLGVSSYQIDTPERGFSTRFNGILDMRMDRNIKKTALNIVRNYKKKELANIFSEYGQLLNANRIANIIIETRRKFNIKTTTDLKNILLKNLKINTKYQQKFLSQVFQALRIEVNDELHNLEIFLENSQYLLKKTGRIITIAYHSLEDKIIKKFFKNNSNIKPAVEKAITPKNTEISINKRSRSAKLRIGIKC